MMLILNRSDADESTTWCRNLPGGTTKIYCHYKGLQCSFEPKYERISKACDCFKQLCGTPDWDQQKPVHSETLI